MIDQTGNVFDLSAVLHPATVFDHPRDVVANAVLSLSEKRAILRPGPRMRRRWLRIPRCANWQAQGVS